MISLPEPEDGWLCDTSRAIEHVPTGDCGDVRHGWLGTIERDALPGRVSPASLRSLGLGAAGVARSLDWRSPWYS